MRSRLVWLCLAGWLSTCAPVSAEITRFEVGARGDVADGRSFGTVGPYEWASGRIALAVDPALAANRRIVDVGLAPRNAAGRVEFSADFYLLKPKAVERGNGTVLLEISNRGGKSMLPFFDRAGGSRSPRTGGDVGDGFLLEQGFTLLWVGWQFDVPPGDDLLRLRVPVASLSGEPIRGLVRSDFVVARRTADASLADREHQAYPVADPEDPAAVMTVRDGVDGGRQVVPRERWRFARDEQGKIVPDRTRVHLAGGFEPGRIYEVVYVAQDPPVAGLGFAAVRDAVSALKHEGVAPLAIPAGALPHAIAFGISQSGRFLRTYLYDGFNADERGRRVLDGVMAHVAGAGRGSFNVRFAQPSRDGHPFLNFFYPTDIFPFTDQTQTDRETGATDGLLARAGPPDVLPRIFYTNASYEYWGRAASLIHTTVDGLADAPVPDNVRIYTFIGGQHGAAPFPPPRTQGRHLNNPLDYRWSMRALLLAMRRWIATGEPPPPSRYPRVEGGTLVGPADVAFPRIPSVETPTRPHRAYRADYGPEFATLGLIAHEPPRIGRPFPILVPQVDADGNDRGGVAMPDLAVPLATYTGWNLFDPASGPPQEMATVLGAYLPFPRTKAERERAGDPRRSIEERYAGREHYIGLVSLAGLALVEDGFLLDRDLPAILRQSARHWDHVWSGSAPSQDARRAARAPRADRPMAPVESTTGVWQAVRRP
jgi:hypothetical protein